MTALGPRLFPFTFFSMIMHVDFFSYTLFCFLLKKRPSCSLLTVFMVLAVLLFRFRLFVCLLAFCSRDVIQALLAALSTDFRDHLRDVGSRYCDDLSYFSAMTLIVSIV